MPYAFYHDHSFIFIDSTSKNGLFCQFFSSPYSPKPIQIQFQGTKEYSAHLSPEGKLYVAAMPDAFHLNYYTLENNRFVKNSLVSNKVSNYQLSHPMIYTLNNQPFMVYLSHQLHSNNYNFVHENLLYPNLTTLLTSYFEPEQIKYYLSASTVYIFYVTHNENYQLNALCISPQKTWVITYIQSSLPIYDYSVCLDGDCVHLAYVIELHGKYQLFYCNPEINLITPLITTQYPSNPVVFHYYHALWINAAIEHKLHMFISMDQGQTFSIPVPCSLQNSLHRCHFTMLQDSSLIANELYASVNSGFRLCTISMIDIEHLHADTDVPPELELLLEGLILSAKSASSAPPPAANNPPSPPADNTHGKSPHSVEQAKNDFMDHEMNGWDLPPLI